MHRATTGSCPRERGAEGIVLEQRPVRARAIDADEILEEDPAGADRQVPDLRVPHLPVGQPDGRA